MSDNALLTPAIEPAHIFMLGSAFKNHQIKRVVPVIGDVKHPFCKLGGKPKASSAMPSASRALPVTSKALVWGVMPAAIERHILTFPWHRFRQSVGWAAIIQNGIVFKIEIPQPFAAVLRASGLQKGFAKDMYYGAPDVCFSLAIARIAVAGPTAEDLKGSSFGLRRHTVTANWRSAT